MALYKCQYSWGSPNTDLINHDTHKKNYEALSEGVEREVQLSLNDGLLFLQQAYL